MGTKVIIHISEVDISPTTGMGRVEWYWKKAFEDRGIRFVHIGPKEVGKLPHPGLFPFYAKKHFKQLKVKPIAFIVHEPACGYFINEGVPCFLESHGVEQRYWELWSSGKIEGEIMPSFKSKVLYPIWRLWGANRGLKQAHKLLLLNKEDKTFVQKRYGRREEDIFVFDNGVESSVPPKSKKDNNTPTIIFNGSWLPRKGIITLSKAIKELYLQNPEFHLLLIGTGTHTPVDTIRSFFPSNLNVEIVPSFSQYEERSLLFRSDIFVLPSFYEGKPLSLLQAMETGLCCVTSDTCGQKDIITHEENGFLFTPGDAVALSKILLNLIKDEGKRIEVGRKAAQTVQQLSWPVVSNKVLDFVMNNIE